MSITSIKRATDSVKKKQTAIQKVRGSQARAEVVNKLKLIRKQVSNQHFILNSATYKALSLISTFANFSKVSFGANTITSANYRTRKQKEFMSFRLNILTKINELQQTLQSQEQRRTITRSTSNTNPVTFESLPAPLKEKHNEIVMASKLGAGNHELYDIAIEKLMSLYKQSRHATQMMQRLSSTEINATVHHRRAENYLTALSCQLNVLQKNLVNSIAQFNQFLSHVSPDKNNPAIYKDGVITGQQSMDMFVDKENIPEAQNFPKSMPTPQRAVTNQATPVRPSPLRDFTDVQRAFDSEEGVTTDEDSRSSRSSSFSSSNGSDSSSSNGSSASSRTLSRNNGGQAFFMTANRWISMNAERNTLPASPEVNWR
jgi:hypothetical protein